LDGPLTSQALTGTLAAQPSATPLPRPCLKPRVYR
jgi:hypothetical protein